MGMRELELGAEQALFWPILDFALVSSPGPYKRTESNLKWSHLDPIVIRVGRFDSWLFQFLSSSSNAKIHGSGFATHILFENLLKIKPTIRPSSSLFMCRPICLME